MKRIEAKCLEMKTNFHQDNKNQSYIQTEETDGGGAVFQNDVR